MLVQRLVAGPTDNGADLSLADLVADQDGGYDLVVALGNGGEHPPLQGSLVRTRRKVVFIPYSAMAGIYRWEVSLTTSDLQPHPLPDHNGLVTLAGDLRDRQILDPDGRIVRVSDRVLACMVDEIRLVARTSASAHCSDEPGLHG